MSNMATVNRAFIKALDGKASADGIIMVYERGDDGKQRQRLTGFITVGGTRKTVTGLFDGRADLVAAAEQLAAEFAAANNLTEPASAVWDADAERANA
jgi:hypothetical protein